jgi:hypothetical protein
LHDQEGRQQQGQILQTAASRFSGQWSLQDQQLLAEEQDLAVLVTESKLGTNK